MKVGDRVYVKSKDDTYARLRSLVGRVEQVGHACGVLVRFAAISKPVGLPVDVLGRV